MSCKVKSLVTLTAELVEKFKFSEMRSLPDDLLELMFERAKGNKERTMLIMYAEFNDYDCRSPLTVVARYENITKAQLPFEIMKDDKLRDKGLFHRLLEHHEALLQKHQEVYGDALAKMHDDDEWWGDTMVIPAKLIKYLYTKILTPSDLLRDIKVVGEPSEESYHICYQDETFWKCLDRTYLV